MNRREAMAGALAGIAVASLPAPPVIPEMVLICSAVDYEKGVITYSLMSRSEANRLFPKHRGP